MSISSMTNIAISRIAGSKASTYRDVELAAATPQGTQTDATSALKAMATYIPSEVLTLYVGVLAALQQGNKLPPSAQMVFWTFLVVTPVVVWLVYAAKVRAGGGAIPWALDKWPMWEMTAAAIGFAAWGVALPDNPFKDQGWYSSAVAGVGVVVTSTLLGLIAPLVKK